MRLRVASILVVCLAYVRSPAAQPLDPYKDPPASKQAPKQPPPTRAPLDPYASPPAARPPAPPPPTVPSAPAPVTPPDPVLAEQVARSLVQRAQELYDARVFVDAKQLAVEALDKSPKGAAAEQARFLIKAINQQLGLVEPQPAPAVDLSPIKDPAEPRSVDTAPEVPARASRITSGVHSALYVGLLGATVGAFFDEASPAGGAVPVGIASGLAAGVYLPRVLDRLKWNDGQIRTMGAGSVWGGVIGGLFADAVKTQGTKASHVLVGASLGATVGGIGAAAFARRDPYTQGDVALVDTLAAIGATGGLAVGMLMQPAETEAYSVNSIIGATAGLVIGMIAAPQTNTTPRRMLRVAGVAAGGGAVPFLLYAGIYDSSTASDERVVGLLSSAGLVVGAWVGFRLTRDLDVGLDVRRTRAAPKADAPIALVGRHSDGRWTIGAPTLQPLSPQLAPQRGMTVPLLGATF